MTIQEFIEENNQEYDLMKFKYEYFTRDSFYSFAHIEACRRYKHFIPTKKWYIKDNKLYIICTVGNRPIKFINFIKRDYPRDLEVFLDVQKDKTILELDTTGASLKFKGQPDTWEYELDEY